MKNFFANIKTRYLIGIVVAIVFAVFNLLVFVLSDMSKAQANFWCGYVFCCIAFVIMAAIILITTIPKKQIFSVVSPFYMGTLGYLFVTLIFNTILICFPDGSGWDAKLGIIPNIVLLSIYLIFMILAFIGARHIAQDTQQTYQAVVEIRSLANVTLSLESEIASPSARQEVHRLGEDIKYSDPMGNGDTASLDDDLRRAIDILKELVFNEASEEEITKAAKRARAILRNRNAVLKSTKVS